MKEMNKFHVKIQNLKLHGFYRENEKDNAVSIEIKWKGPQRHGLLSVPFYPKSFFQRNRTSHQLLRKGESVDWEDEFESICEFSTGDVGFWETKFYVLFGDSSKPRTKMAVLGKESLNLAELVSKREMAIEKNIPITLTHSSCLCHATLSVRVNFVEVRDCPNQTGFFRKRNPIEDDKGNGFLGSLKNLTSFRKKNRENGNLFGLAATAEESEVPRPEQTQKELFWKKRRLSFSSRHSKRKVEPLIEKTCTPVNDVCTVGRQQDDKLSSRFFVPPISAGSKTEAENSQYKKGKEGSWETREIVSRDGKTKLKTEVFYGSFDQRSEKAGGESACTAIVVIITHWLHLNRGSMPTRSQLDSLIMEGSSEWQKLCNIESYSNSFPNKHFDLETIVEADVKPIAVLPEKSFVGFFKPEKFNCLTDVMSFEQIWNEISRKTVANWEPRIYIVSWNDHFFVLKMDEDACYIVDSLGERLFEGCNQAYMLKFDSSSLMFENTEKGEAGEIVCRGKECCREFFERFLAAITIEQLEDEQKKLTSCNYTLHQRMWFAPNTIHEVGVEGENSHNNTCHVTIKGPK